MPLLTLYHATPETRVADILANGLDPLKSESSLQAVYLSDLMDVAANYESMKAEKCALLEVTIDTSEYTLGADNYELQDHLESMEEGDLAAHGLDTHSPYWNDCDWTLSLKLCNQIACHTRIPPQFIKVLSKAVG